MSRLLPLGFLTALVLVVPALAVYPPPLKDDGKFFSKEGVEKANKKIRDIYEKYKKDVVIETLPNLSTEQEKKLNEDGKGKFFARMARERSVALGLNGVYIAIVKKPTHLQVHMDPDTQKKLFTAANRKTLIDKIVAQFKEDAFDQGLLDGLDAIEKALKANSTSK
jgi:uncharacterized membrane protein YgcG